VALGRRERARVFRDSGQVKRGADDDIISGRGDTLASFRSHVRVKHAAELEQHARGLTVSLSLGERRSEIDTIGCLWL
jgi:hypothetical protein